MSGIAKGLEQYDPGVSGLVKVIINCTVAVEYVEHHTFNTHIPSITQLVVCICQLSSHMLQ